MGVRLEISSVAQAAHILFVVECDTVERFSQKNNPRLVNFEVSPLNCDACAQNMRWQARLRRSYKR